MHFLALCFTHRKILQVIWQSFNALSLMAARFHDVVAPQLIMYSTISLLNAIHFIPIFAMTCGHKYQYTDIVIF